jgi:hypothetical protein
MRYALTYPKRHLLRAFSPKRATQLLAAFGPPNPPAVILLLEIYGKKEIKEKVKRKREQ